MIILAVLLVLSVCCGIYQKRKTYRMIDRLLDRVLNQEMIVYSDVEEGEYSALISKIKQIQEVLGNHAQSAEREKEQVKSLVSNMSHQLKTPLANLSLYTEILETGELAPEKKAEFADKMQRQIEKLNWIVESLSKMVKLEQNIDEFEVQDTKIKQTILDAVDAVYAKLEKKGIRLEMEEFDDRLLYHNRKWTVEVFVNLLENAIKYAEPGGAIRIQVRPYELYTEIQIADTGRGIRQEELTDIFKRFYRSPEVENMEGSGIGLYLSNLILEKEKGYITAVSEYGKGSCFSVFLQNCKKRIIRFVTKLQDPPSILEVSRKGAMTDEYFRITECGKNIRRKRKSGQGITKYQSAGGRGRVCCYRRHVRLGQIDTSQFNRCFGQSDTRKDFHQEKGNRFFVEERTDYLPEKKYWFCLSELQLDAGAECI